MKQQKWKPYVFFTALSEAVGLLSAWLTRNAIDLYSQGIEQPPLSPPAIVFPVVWTILYALMGIGAARVYLAPESPARSRGLNLFILQLAVNFLWSPIFFNAQAFGFALIWLLLLWVLVLGMILTFRKVDPAAAALQIPYLMWLTFAAYLNAGILLLNR